MHPRKHRLIFAGVLLLALILAALAVVAVGRRGVLVVVRNSGSQTMTNVQVTLGGKQIALGNIPARSSASGRVVPVADSGVVITYTDNSGASRVVPANTYVTGGLSGRIDANVRDGQLKGYKEDLHTSIL